MRYFLIPVLLAGCVTPDMTAEQQACMAKATRDVPQRLDYAGIDLNHDIRMTAYNACISSGE